MTTMFEKVWADHVVTPLSEDADLVWIDRHYSHDLSGPFSMKTLSKRSLACRRPDLTFALPDHGVSTEPGRSEASTAAGSKMLPALRRYTSSLRIQLFDLDDARQGIVHVVGPELGLTLPGMLVVCGDSHTCTQGGVGALGWGIGNTEVTQLLATQALNVLRPKPMLVRIEGQLSPYVTAKDVILHLIARDGADAGSGHAIEFGGSTVRMMSVEARLTLCNLSVDFGASIGFVAPDETTYAYLDGRPYAPRGSRWDDAVDYWRSIPSDDDVGVEACGIAPQVSCGTSPAHTIGVDDLVPDPADAPDESTARAWSDALQYVGLRSREPIAGVPVQHVFIGSCTNSRLEDLKRAAAVVRGRRVASGVRAWVVPGSGSVKREAEQLGLHEIFVAAGFAWREPGCSMCMSMNGDVVAPGERCISTSNRNFVGRQGPGARTHLASPETAAATAITGHITDPRRFGEESV